MDLLDSAVTWMPFAQTALIIDLINNINSRYIIKR